MKHLYTKQVSLRAAGILGNVDFLGKRNWGRWKVVRQEGSCLSGAREVLNLFVAALDIGSEGPYSAVDPTDIAGSHPVTEEIHERRADGGREDADGNCDCDRANEKPDAVRGHINSIMSRTVMSRTVMFRTVKC